MDYDKEGDMLTVIMDNEDEGEYHETGDGVDLKVNRQGRVVGAIIYHFSSRAMFDVKDFMLHVPVKYSKHKRIVHKVGLVA